MQQKSDIIFDNLWIAAAIMITELGFIFMLTHLLWTATGHGY